MIFECRRYNASPTKLPSLVARFRDTTVHLFARHGFDAVGFWTTDVGESNHHLHYLLRWPYVEARQRRWKAFRTDNEWVAALRSSDANGPLVNHVHNETLGTHRHL